MEEAGYEAVYAAGFCVEASYGYPDTGMLTMPECACRAAAITAATDLPVICGADTGFGNAVNVIRTVREFERAGGAAIHLEDQVSPERCCLRKCGRTAQWKSREGKSRRASLRGWPRPGTGGLSDTGAISAEHGSLRPPKPPPAALP